jgi:integration host factor subunit alpha
MPGRTITRVDLANAVARSVDLSRQDSQDLLDQMFEEIIDALARGESVRLSSFGAFEVRQKGERVGRNPKTGEEVPIGARRVVSFRPSDVLKRFINHPSATS